MGDILHVKPTRGDIRRDEDVEVSPPECCHDPGACGLFHVSVEAVHIVSAASQQDVEGVGLLAGAAEDDCLRNILRLDEADGRIGALMLLDDKVALLNVVVRALRLLGLQFQRVVENVAGKRLDLLRHGRRKEHRLVRPGKVLEDLLHVVDESHVQHFVRLVHDDDGGVCIVEVA